MTLSTTINKVSYSGTGSQDTFAYTYKIFSSSDIEVYIRDTSGTETKKTITTHYTVSNVGNASGGNIVFTTGNTPLNTDTVIIVRTVPLTQTFDYVLNDPFPSDSHEDGLDKLTMQVQQVKEEVDRSIKASVSTTIASTEFTQSSTDRANKLFGFDSAGNISVTTNVGTNRGDWAASTSYNERDLVKDTSTNNVFQVTTAHTSSGSQPLTSNANSAKYTLLVDAASATTSATAAATSATAAAGSATTAQGHSNTASGHKDTATTKANEASASASTAAGHVSTASGHSTNASNSAAASASSATASATTLTNFEKQYLGSKSSAPTTDNDGVTLDASYEGTLYFNSTTDDLYVWNGSAWEQASFSAGGFLSQANNLSDVANASTARTNLGLGTASTLTAGTSANNAVQLDGNAKLPAVSGENLTGLSSGTDAIDMTVASGSDAISAGNVVTRESNGETAKVKKTVTTSNLALGASTVNVAMSTANYDFAHSSGTYRANYPGHTFATANDNGKYVFIYHAGNHTMIMIFNYDSASSTWTVPSNFDGSTEKDYNISTISGGNPYVNGTAFQGAGGNFRSGTSLHYLRWHKNMNASAGGTYLLIWKYQHSAGNNQRYVTPITITESNVVTVHNRMTILQHPSYSNQDFFTDDTSVISMGTNEATFVSAGQWYLYYSHPYTSDFVISTAQVTWNGSSYSRTYLSKQAFTSINGNPSRLTSQDRPVRVMYDYTTSRLGIFWLDTNRRNRFTCWTNTGTTSSPTWTAQYTEQLTTDNNNGTFDNNAQWYSQFQKADGKGRVLFSYRHTYYSPSTTYGAKWLCISMGASSLTIQTVASTNSTSSTIHSAPVQSFHYDYLNDRYIVPYSGSLSTVGQSQHMRLYIPSGTGIAQDSAVSGGGSGTYQWGRALAIVDTMTITGITNADAGKWLQIGDSDTSTYSSLSANAQNSYYHAGNIPHTLTTNTTNKALAFGFAQKAGSAGNTISVLPFDSESIEQNQTSLTHGTKYYVSSTGALSTSTTPDSDINADPENPFVGEAIHTTNLRLPSKNVAGSGGADSKIFCGSYDFRVDGSSTAQNVLISLPAGNTVANVRAYEINFYGIGFASDGNHFCYKPYNGTSSVVDNGFYATSHYSHSSDGANNKTETSAIMLNWISSSRDQYSANDVDNPKQNYNNDSGWGGQITGQHIYTNSLKNGSSAGFSTWRFGTGGQDHAITHSTHSRHSDNSTDNYADGFYFFVGDSSQAEQNVAIMEGVVSVYAVIG